MENKLKKTMVLEKISKLLPAQETEFLIFMAKTVNFSLDYTGMPVDTLLDMFIEFEESQNETELTDSITDELLSIYVPGYINGESF
jgi:hypothetical protein